MPNWVNGDYAIKGSKKNVLNFLNEGLKNSGCKPQRTCKKAFELLLTNAKSKTCDFRYGENAKGTSADNPADIILENKLTLDTFHPMPDTFYMYDTTNREKDMPEIAAMQRREYGAVGWYDYGTHIHRGTKWNADLEGVELVTDKTTATFKFHCDTAWSDPDCWLRWVKETFKVNVFLCVHEESNAFNFYGEIDYTEEDYEDFSEIEGRPQEDDFDDEDEYWDALSEWQSECIEEMSNKFQDFVSDYDIDDFD